MTEKECKHGKFSTRAPFIAPKVWRCTQSFHRYNQHMQAHDWTEVNRKKPAVAKPKPLTQSNASIPNAWSGKPAVATSSAPKAKVVTNSQRTSDFNKRSLDKDDGNYSVQRVGTKCGQAMVAARQAKGLTQKDLALQAQEKIQVIQDYESGRAVPNQKVLTKFERVLGVQLKGLVQKRSKDQGIQGEAD